jgi:hypothetical protein
MKSLPLVMLSVLLPWTSQAAVKSKSLQEHEIVTDKELLITSLEVVNGPEASYPGPWSFGHLMDEAFGKELSRKAVAAWLDKWAKGEPGTSPSSPGVAPRESLEEVLIAPWRQRDGHAPGTEWLPDFSHAPFRLLAVVNRMDLGKHAAPPAPSPDGFTDLPTMPGGYGSGSSLANSDAGEARLVFGAVDATGQPLAGGMTIIFEYGLDAPPEKSNRPYDWALAWHRLGARKSFDAVYRADLARLTRLFTDRRETFDTTPKERENDPLQRLAAEAASASMQLLRVRVNDGAGGKLREFREFIPRDGKLNSAALPGTPHDSFFEKGSVANRLLSDWLAEQRVVPASQQENPRAKKTEIPPSFSLPVNFRSEGEPLLVGTTVAEVRDNDATFHWDGWGLRDEELRRAFSMQTCCGCHCGDTSSAFFHIAPASAESEATLSKFLRTDGSRWRPKDPSNGRTFLSSEIDDRKQLFENLLNPSMTHRALDQIRGARKGRVH